MGSENNTGAGDTAAIANSVETKALAARLQPLKMRAARVVERLEEWFAEPTRARRSLAIAGGAVLLAGLVLPPVELPSRILSLGYTPLRPGEHARISSNPSGAFIEVFRHDIVRPGRMSLRGTDRMPAALPNGQEPIGQLWQLDLKGTPPRQAELNVHITVPADEQAFLDPYGWDGHRWRWLAVSFPSPDTARIELQPASFLPETIVMTRATEAATQVSAVLLPPPNTVPAAVAELPILEMEAFRLESDDGSLAGDVFPVPAHPEGRYAVVSNVEPGRIRYDLVINLLSQRTARERHRAAIVDIVRREKLAGVVLDYRAIPGDLQTVYADWLRRLKADLGPIGGTVIVTVPMPTRNSGSWDPGTYSWQALGAATDGVRVLLPNDRPLATAELDAMVRWGLQLVERQKLQLSVPVRGRDILDDPVRPEVRDIAFGDALAKILNIAQADAPGRLSPAESANIELRTVAASGLAQDPDTGMWRFGYWDANRRPHTVWLNDAEGLKPAFDIAGRYRLGRLALQGVSAGLDPALWHLVQTFRETGEAELVPGSYQLTWQLLDDLGTVVREAQQPLADTVFAFRAPETEGHYQLAVNLVGADGRLVVPGKPRLLVVGPPPPPTPTPTPPRILMIPTVESAATEPPPRDESTSREPITANVTPRSVSARTFDATLAYPLGVLRSGPGTRYSEVGDAKAGDAFDVLARNDDASWLRVRLAATGVEGWILADSLEILVEIASLPTEESATPTPQGFQG
jgi:hypothetical protein